MSATTNHQPAEISAPAVDEPDVLHIVEGFWEGFVIERLYWLVPPRFRRAPRALCGELMWGDPDQPDPAPYPHTPFCPTCVAIDGRDIDTIAATGEHVPSTWI